MSGVHPDTVVGFEIHQAQDDVPGQSVDVAVTDQSRCGPCLSLWRIAELSRYTESNPFVPLGPAVGSSDDDAVVIYASPEKRAILEQGLWQVGNIQASRQEERCSFKTFYAEKVGDTCVWVVEVEWAATDVACPI